MKSSELDRLIKKYQKLPRIDKLVLIVRKNGDHVIGKVRLIHSSHDLSVIVFQLDHGYRLTFDQKVWRLCIDDRPMGEVKVKWGSEIMGL